MSLIMPKDKSSEIHIEKLLGIKIHSKLYFWWSCKKVNIKLRALAPAIP